jgi:predicted phage terminase large subunit-like protein
MADEEKQDDVEEKPKRKAGRPKGSGVIPRKNVTYKVCRECLEVKPASEFYVRKENKDGLFHSCKACMDKRTNRNNHKKQAARRREKLIEEGATMVCSKCGKEKPVEDFPKNVKTKNGVSSVCTECRKEAAKATRQKKLDRAEQERLYMIEREMTLRKGRENFFNFCQILAPDFYRPERWHLWLLCNTLQALYERHLTKKYFRALCTMPHIPKWLAEKVIDWDRLEDGKVYTKLMINMSPRSGKSRSLTMFADWLLGKSKDNRIITVSYNTDLAANMSRYVRDGSMQQKVLPTDIVYADIFPDTRIAKGNAGFMKWSLEGSFFNYLGTGMEGTLTGTGGNCLICDDLIKNANEAYNERVLDDIWNWYVGTFMSRSEHTGQGSIELINFTRWSTHDLCGRILESPMGKDWANLIIPVEYEGEIYCEDILPREEFERLREGMDTNIFEANYYQHPLDVEGRLFGDLKTYDTLPEGTEKFIAYCDTADEGSDYLACICGAVYQGEGYVTDIYYTQETMQVTEPATAKLLVKNTINHAKIESNNGGKGFARNVEQIIWDEYHTKQVNIEWFHQTENKMARILTGSTFVQNHVYMPQNWDKRWPEFYKHVMGFSKDGKNKHDDGVEALVEWGKMITGDGSINSYIEYMKRLAGVRV